MDIMEATSATGDDEETTNISIDQASSGLDQRLHVERRGPSIAPFLQMDKLMSSSLFDMNSPVGSKRKAVASPNTRGILLGSSQREATPHEPQQDEAKRTTTTSRPKKTELSALSTRLGYGDPVSPRSKKSGASSSTITRQASPRSWPLQLTAMDDLDGASLHSQHQQGLPKKRQRYQRRNSFLVHRDSTGRLAAASSVLLEDIRQACFDVLNDEESEDHSSSSTTAAAERIPPPSSGTTSSWSLRRRDTANKNYQEEGRVLLREGDLMKSSPSSSVVPSAKNKADGREEDVLLVQANDWGGHASWSNSDDTRWYSEFSSSLSFSSKTTLPPPALPLADRHHDYKKKNTNDHDNSTSMETTSMLPPPPPRPVPHQHNYQHQEQHGMMMMMTEQQDDHQERVLPTTSSIQSTSNNESFSGEDEEEEWGEETRASTSSITSSR